MEVRNQLDGEQGKSPPFLPAKKASDGNPSFFEARKQINGVAKIGRNLTVAIRSAADGAGRPKVGEKIDSVGCKRFLVFPNRIIFVKVG
jgi:hypothetical protein